MRSFISVAEADRSDRMIELEHVSFSYGEHIGENDREAVENKNGVRDISLHISDGECVVLCGESGCGKTTVTRLINGLIPHYYEGKLTGSVLVNGAEVSKQPLYDTAKLTGSVFQNPRSQFFNVDTTSELSFGCENLGMPEALIRERLDRTIREFRLQPLMDRSIFELSGGEKQKIACAGAAMMEPEVYVLDEPSSNLDVTSIRDLRKIIAFWKKQGKTIVISEHRLYYLKGIADRFLYLRNGQIEREYSAEEFAVISEEERKAMGLRTFSPERIQRTGATESGKGELRLHGFQFSYKGGRQILQMDDCVLPASGIVGIIGNNGAGKSTFSRCLCGLEKRCGEVFLNGKKYRPKDRLNLCYMVMQEVNHQLFTESVLDEVLISMDKEDPERAKEILKSLDLGDCLDRHPMSLSGGQKQRVAIASAIASGRRIMILDEPTSGLDYRHMKEVAGMLQQLQAEKISLYIITHDLELLLECCTDIVHLEQGTIREQYALDEAGVEKVREYYTN